MTHSSEVLVLRLLPVCFDSFSRDVAFRSITELVKDCAPEAICAWTTYAIPCKSVIVMDCNLGH